MNVDTACIISIVFISIMHLVKSSDNSDTRQTFRTFLLNIEDVTKLNENLKEDLHRINETNNDLQADTKALKENLNRINETNKELQADNKARKADLLSMNESNQVLKEQVTEMNQTISNLQVRLTGMKISSIKYAQLKN